MKNFMVSRKSLSSWLIVVNKYLSNKTSSEHKSTICLGVNLFFCESLPICRLSQVLPAFRGSNVTCFYLMICMVLIQRKIWQRNALITGALVNAIYETKIIWKHFTIPFESTTCVNTSLHGNIRNSIFLP